MIQIQVTPESAAQVDAYLEATRLRIFAAVKAKMTPAMEGLSNTIADKLQGNPIVSRSGALMDAVLNGIKVRETSTAIIGSVNPDTHDNRNLALWLEDGHNEPAVAGNLLSFLTSDSMQAFTHGHKAFHVPGHPFMNPSLEEYAPTILEMISQAVVDAME